MKYAKHPGVNADKNGTPLKRGAALQVMTYPRPISKAVLVDGARIFGQSLSAFMVIAGIEKIANHLKKPITDLVPLAELKALWPLITVATGIAEVTAALPLFEPKQSSSVASVGKVAKPRKIKSDREDEWVRRFPEQSLNSFCSILSVPEVNTDDVKEALLGLHAEAEELNIEERFAELVVGSEQDVIKPVHRQWKNSKDYKPRPHLTSKQLAELCEASDEKCDLAGIDGGWSTRWRLMLTHGLSPSQLLALPGELMGGCVSDGRGFPDCFLTVRRHRNKITRHKLLVDLSAHVANPLCSCRLFLGHRSTLFLHFRETAKAIGLPSELCCPRVLRNTFVYRCLGAGWSVKQVASYLGVGQTAISPYRLGPRLSYIAGNVKLSPWQCLEIRRKRFEPAVEVAAQYGVNRNTIIRIRNGKERGHIQLIPESRLPEINGLMVAGMQIPEIAQKTGLHPDSLLALHDSIINALEEANGKATRLDAQS
jgi:hypothetical protein